MSNVLPLTLPTPEQAEQNRRTQCTRAVHGYIQGGTDSLKNLPLAIKNALACEAWKERLTPNGQVVSNNSLLDWIDRPYPFGIGATVELVRDLIWADKGAVKLWTKAVKRAGGAPKGNNNAGKAKTTLYNVQGCSEKKTAAPPSGNTSEAAIRRLETEAANGSETAASLLDRVTAGELSPNAAAIEAGHRKKKITVRAEADALFAALMKTATAPEIALMAIKACDDEGLRTIFAGLADVLMARR